MTRRLALPAAALLMLALSAPLLAQNTDIEALSGIHFSFGNPGARSLAMGGAFVGLADDASAAEANPAGLTILRKPEISIEGRNFRVASQVPVSGTYPNLVNQEFSAFSRRAEIAFASFVYPVKDFAISGYYHQSVRYTNSATVLPQLNSRGQTVRQVPNFYLPRGGTPVTLAECQAIRLAHPTDAGACLEYRIFPFVTAVDVDLKTIGLAGAWKKGKFSFGLAAKYQEFQEGAFTFRSDFFGNPNSIAVQATGKLVNGNVEIKSEKDLTWTVGAKWTPLENLGFGVVYKKGASFDAPTFAQVTGSAFGKIADTTFHVPDVAGLGASWRPLPLLTVNADVYRVSYSNLTDQFYSINDNIRALGQSAYETKDAVEWHFGAEYFIPTKIPFAIRGGWWRDPAHALTFKGPVDASQNVAAKILFPGSVDEDHYSMGVGLAWPSFQIDAAYDTSTSYKVGSLSAVYRF